jgi:DNA-binding MarR family transcriptional regulator
MGTDRTDELAAELRPVLTQLHFMIRRTAPGPDVTPAQLATLQALHRLGAIRMGELAHYLRVRLPTATSAVDALERMGLAERNPDPSDGRAVIVGLSEAGRELTSRLTTERNKVLSSLLHQLATDEVDSLEAAVPALIHLVDRYRDEA